GQDEPVPAAAAKIGLRQQALGWLRGELATWEPWLEKGPIQARAMVARTLRHWRQDPDLARVRDPDAPAGVPARGAGGRRAARGWGAGGAAEPGGAGGGEGGGLAPPAGELPAGPFAR